MGDGFSVSDIVTVIDLFKPYLDPILNMVIGIAVLGGVFMLIMKGLGWGGHR